MGYEAKLDQAANVVNVPAPYIDAEPLGDEPNTVHAQLAEQAQAPGDGDEG